MVFKNKSKQTGTGLKNSVLYKMLNASYTDKNETPNFIYSKNSVYDLDDDLSTNEVKVYPNFLKKQVVVVVRGTQSLRDIGVDMMIPVGLLETSRYKEAEKILDKVIDYYHKTLGYKVDVIGHSLGGKIAYEISRNLPEDPNDTTLRPEIHELITVNSAGSYEDKLTTNPPNKWDIKTPDFLKRFGLTTPQPYKDEQGNSHTIEIGDKESKTLLETFSGFFTDGVAKATQTMKSLVSDEVASPTSPTSKKGIMEIHSLAPTFEYLNPEEYTGTKIPTIIPPPSPTIAPEEAPAIHPEELHGAGISKKKLKQCHIYAILLDSNKWTTTNARKWFKKCNLKPIQKVCKTHNYNCYKMCHQDDSKYQYKIVKGIGNIDYVLGIPK